MAGCKLRVIGMGDLILLLCDESSLMIDKYSMEAELCAVVQAGARWRSFDKARQGRFVQRVGEALMSDRVTPEIRRIWVGYWSQCEPQLGQQIAVLLQQHSMM